MAGGRRTQCFEADHSIFLTRCWTLADSGNISNEPPNEPPDAATDPAFEKARARNKRMLLLMAAIAFVPMIGAWIVTSLPGERNWLGDTSAGELLQSPPSLDELGLVAIQGELEERRWRLILDARDCQAECELATHNLRQIPILLAREGARVLPVWVHDPDPTRARVNPPLDMAGLPQTQVTSSAWPDAYRGGLLLVDPLGNVIMYYRAEQVDKPLLTDLKKLLKFSKVG